MPDKRIPDLIVKLHQKTLQGNVPWEEGASEEEYLANFPSSSVVLSRRYDRDQDGYDYHLRLYNNQGKLIDEIWNTDAPELYTTMGELYNTARSQAMGVTKALDEIFTQLDSTESKPSKPKEDVPW